MEVLDGQQTSSLRPDAQQAGIRWIGEGAPSHRHQRLLTVRTTLRPPHRHAAAALLQPSDVDLHLQEDRCERSMELCM